MRNLLSAKTFTILLLAISFVLFIPSLSNAQNRTARKKILLTSLKEGTLIVRLKSHQKKLAKLDELINSETTSVQAKKRYSNIKAQTILNRDKFNKDFASTMLNQYRFSKVLVMYDRDYDKLKNNELDSIFLDQDLQLLTATPSIQGEVFYFGEGQTATSGNSLEGILLLDTNNEQVPDWLPNFYKAKNSWKALKGSDYLYHPASKILEKFQGKLNRLWANFEKK